MTERKHASPSVSAAAARRGEKETGSRAKRRSPQPAPPEDSWERGKSPWLGTDYLRPDASLAPGGFLFSSFSGLPRLWMGRVLDAFFLFFRLLDASEGF